MTVLWLVQRLVKENFESIGMVCSTYNRKDALKKAHQNPLLDKLLKGYGEDVEFLDWFRDD